jgi:putative pyruvate formate lyase activating enzyme
MSTLDAWPRYRSLDAAELGRRAERALEELEDCRACPRDCRVDRLHDEIGVCKTGRYAVVASRFAHFGEEDCLRGWQGSGTIFFSHCNLRCVFCQNYDISQGVKAKSERGVPPTELADMMLELQQAGCHNINFVTPEHVVPQLVEALPIAIARGLRLPIVYNTSAYDALSSLELMDGLVDVYMPDLKLWSTESCRRYLLAADYPEVARAALLEMHRQVGPLELDERGLARRGVLIRHLVMPGLVDESEAILDWIATTLGPDSYVNLMDQYFPAGRVAGERYGEIGRRVSPAEMSEVREHARRLGLRLDARRLHPLGP